MESAFSPYSVHRAMQEEDCRCRIVILISPTTQSIHDQKMIRAPISTLELGVRGAALSWLTLKMTRLSSMSFYKE